MKKILFFIVAAMLATVAVNAAEASIENVFGPSTFGTFVNAYDKTFTNTSGTVLLVSNFNNGQENGKWTEIRCGRKSVASVATITTQSALEQEITKVVVNFSAFKTGVADAAYLEVAATNDFTSAQKIDVTLAEGEVVIAIPAPAVNQYYRLTISCDNSNSNNGEIRISKINFVYNVPELHATNISLNKTTLTLNQYYAETLTATVEPEDATDPIVWTSTAPAVATVENGKVTALTAGTATITATAGEFSVSCTVTVNAAPETLTCEYLAGVAVAPAGEVTVTGYVTSIKTEWSEQHGNISFFIADTKGGGDVFQCYRAIPNDGVSIAVVDDNVTVTGMVGFYNGTPQMAQGGTYEIKGSTGLTNLAVNNRIYAIEGKINAPKEARIFNLIGMDVTHQNGQLENGIFLVKVGKSVTKVLVKK